MATEPPPVLTSPSHLIVELDYGTSLEDAMAVIRAISLLRPVAGVSPVLSSSAKRTGPRTVEVVYEGLITSGNHDNVDLRCAGCGETPCIKDNRGCCPNRPDEEQTT
jgi:hypothetical protein